MNTSQSYQSFEKINIGTEQGEPRLGRMVSIPYNFTISKINSTLYHL